MNNNITLSTKVLIFSSLAVLIIASLVSFYFFRSGHKSGYESGYSLGEEEGEVKGFNESFLNTAEKYLKSRKLEKQKPVNFKNLDMDFREISKK
ncbi:MAG: hypothetical protein AAFR87_35625, partial [Bacteroidota bacterium]